MDLKVHMAVIFIIIVIKEVNGINIGESCDSAVCMTTGYELDHRRAGVRVPWVQDFSPLHVVRTGCAAHPASYSMGTGALSMGVKRQKREADYSPQTIAEVKNIWINTSSLPYVFMGKTVPFFTLNNTGSLISGIHSGTQ
jgi:hypothetical protein